MKLATLRDGRRDGRLVVVSRDLTRCAAAGTIAPTLQSALDRWAEVAPLLGVLARDVELGSVPLERFHEREAMSPLPRAYQWVDGSAYVNHVELVRKARGAEMPASFWTDPLMYQGGSDAFLGPREPIRVADEAWGIDCEAEVAVIVDDVPMGASRPHERRSGWSCWSTTSVSAGSSRPSSPRASGSCSEAVIGLFAGRGDAG